MECIYYPGFLDTDPEIQITGDEFKHLRALRMLPGEKVLISNGNGLCADTEISLIGNSEAILNIEKLLPGFGELPSRLALAIAILNDRERFEFALEKAVELGITDFIPLISKHTEKKFINSERLVAKAIAALKQCKRAVLPKIYEPVALETIGSICREFQDLILAEPDGNNPGETSRLGSTIILVGPEGGFNDDEITFIKKFNNAKTWSLGIRRLRAETAAISALSIVNTKII